MTTASKTKIEWTESSWNPVTGCTKISPGCANCYAERLAFRLQAMGQKRYQNGFDVTLHEQIICHPLKIRKPTTFFVNSMSDLFHEKISDEFIQMVFSTMNKADWHKFQVLTKRPERLKTLSSRLTWSENIWMGVTIENNDFIHRADVLRHCPAHIKFLSLEPLLGPLPGLNLSDIDWVIVGGESGPGARPMNIDWVRNIRDKCITNEIPFFFKQWGGVQKKKNGSTLDEKTWKQYPNKSSCKVNILHF